MFRFCWGDKVCVLGVYGGPKGRTWPLQKRCGSRGSVTAGRAGIG
ncbi:hypothetical protein CLOHYLEM_07698 [[Clostridium] hylemonae DSM 15053]|uniref:Uncharacterized protein n=1 Tax=[Clostridium] hylemonae DSM 15053 TaxID=553973 RepID=C0C6G1_9FIRM|nr:hypothetical protein CLOHYLEM_07698 [[Clostridium] hylemonae DSM 15053]